MTYDFTIRRIAVQPTMSIRGQTTLADLVGTIGEYMTEVWRYLQESGAQPAGPPFTRHHAVDGASIELEAGLPVWAALPGKGRIRPGQLPGGEVAVTTHVGPYDGLVAAGEALQTWTLRQGREASGPNWGVYVTDPGGEADPSRWRTDLFKPLRGAIA